MANRDTLQDASAILYLVPFLVAGVYGLALWVAGGISAILPSTVYLTVTRSPYVFSAGILAVFVGIALDVDSTDEKGRQQKVSAVSNMLIKMAVASFVLAFIFAIYSAGPVGGVTDFLVGRYNLVFPTLLVVFSFLLSAQFRFEAVMTLRNLGIIAMLLVPASLYVLGRHHTTLAIFATLVLVLFAIFAFLTPWKPKKATAEPPK